MNFDFTLEVLKHELVNQEYKRDYPSIMAVSMSKGFEKRIKELKLAISILQKAVTLDDLFKDAIVVGENTKVSK